MKKKLDNTQLTPIIPEIEDEETYVPKFKSRTLMLMLYPDNPDHKKAVDSIRDADIAYAIVLHDRDTWSADDEIENPDHKAGDVKKPHWHIVLRFSNPCWNTSVCTRFGIEERFCKKADSCDEALEYLIHKNHPDKFQYHVDDVSGDLSSRLAMLVGKDGKTEDEQVLEILHFIEATEMHVSYSQLVRWACQSGHYGYLRQGGSLLCKVLDEHNARLMLSKQLDTKYDFHCFKAFIEGFHAKEIGGIY